MTLEPLLFIVFCCVALGCLVGVLAGMLGIGGGLLIVPVLAYLLKSQLHLGLEHAIPMAVATSLSTILLTAFSSSRAHYRLGNIDPNIVLRCGLGMAIGATLGAQLAIRLPGDVLQNVFAVLVLLVAVKMLFVANKASKNTITGPWLIGIGTMTGGISAMVGIGGGALLVPALVWFRVNIRQAIGCAAVCGLVIAVFGTANFISAGWLVTSLPEWSLGYVYLPASLGIVSTSVFTAPWGARLGQRTNTLVLKRVFAVFLVIISTRMLFG